ncbi:pilus assembly FimT family protein [Desulfobacula sp.]
MSKYIKISGFTLIELVVVISIIAMLLSFSFPTFKNIVLFSNSTGQVGNIIRLINDLKKKAVSQNIDYLMHMDTGSGIIWITNEAMDDYAKEAAKDEGALLLKNIDIVDVEFPGIKRAENQEYVFRFRRQGYSDFALIHIIENKKKITLKIEPFLSQVQILNEHIYLEDCI